MLAAMKRLGFLVLALTLGCNGNDEADTDSGNNSGSGGSTSGSSTTTDSESESETIDSDSDTAGSSSSSSTATASGTGSSGSSSTGDDTTSSSSSTGGSTTDATDDQGLCEDTGGTWDDTACGHYVCGVPNTCEAIIPGCDCGDEANFVEGMGCQADDACTTFACGDDLECTVATEYCQETFPGVKGAPITYACQDMPAACADMVDCPCLTAELGLMFGATCMETVPDGITVQVFAP